MKISKKYNNEVIKMNNLKKILKGNKQIILFFIFFLIISIFLVGGALRPIWGSHIKTNVEFNNLKNYKYFTIIYSKHSLNSGATYEPIGKQLYDYFLERGYLYCLPSDIKNEHRKLFVIYLDVKDGFCLFPGISSRRVKLFFKMPVKVNVIMWNLCGDVLLESSFSRGYFSHFSNFKDIAMLITDDLDKSSSFLSKKKLSTLEIIQQYDKQKKFRSSREVH